MPLQVDEQGEAFLTDNPTLVHQNHYGQQTDLESDRMPGRASSEDAKPCAVKPSQGERTANTALQQQACVTNAGGLPWVAMSDETLIFKFVSSILELQGELQVARALPLPAELIACVVAWNNYAMS